MGNDDSATGQAEGILYCLTRDRELAAGLEARLTDVIAFFYNDAARLHQAVALRPPDVVVIDTAAIRSEYGDAGLGPVVEFVRRSASSARIAVRPAAGAERLVAAEAGAPITMLPADDAACLEAVASLGTAPE